MEHLIRVQNEYDRQTLAWLRAKAGDAAVAAAAQALAGVRKPYLSAVCRSLGLVPPRPAEFRRHAAQRSREVGDRYLNVIRQLLARPACPRPAME
jgi:hypothetical protein